MASATLSNYRIYWASINAPLACVFDGSFIDIDALDFIGYEMGSDFPDGQRGAGIVRGNVFVTCGGFRWLRDDDGFLLVGRLDYRLAGLVFNSTNKVDRDLLEEALRGCKVCLS